MRKKREKGKKNLLKSLSQNSIDKYKKKIKVNEDWVAYKNPNYTPTEASMREGRYNQYDEPAFYVASGTYCAQQEVPNWQDKELFRVNSGEITVFDLPAYSNDNGIYEEFLEAKATGGYNICQDLATTLKNDFSISGIYYNSHQTHQNGEVGHCIAVLPLSGNTIDDKFFFLDSSGVA